MLAGIEKVLVKLPNKFDVDAVGAGATVTEGVAENVVAGAAAVVDELPNWKPLAIGLLSGCDPKLNAALPAGAPNENIL